MSNLGTKRADKGSTEKHSIKGHFMHYNFPKLLIILFSIASMSIGQNNIKGRVLDTLGNPIRNAYVSLFKAGLQDTTDSLGKFVLNNFPTGNSQLQKTNSLNNSPFINNHVLVFNVTQLNSPVTIDVFNASGKLIAHALNKTLKNGAYRLNMWELIKNATKNALYIVRLKNGNETHTLKWLMTASSNVNTAAASNSGLSQLLKADAVAVDTLQVIKNGYIAYRLPLSTTSTTLPDIVIRKSITNSDLVQPEKYWTVTSIYGHGDTLRFDFSGNKPTVKIGSVLVGQMNGGYLRKVSAIIDTSGSSIIVLTQQASLLDIIKEGVLDSSINIQPSQPIILGAMQKVSITKSGEKVITEIGGGLVKAKALGVSITLTNIRKYFGGDTIKIDTLTLNGTIGLDFKADIGLSGVRYLKIVFNLSLSNEFKAGIGMDASLLNDFNEEFELGEFPIGGCWLPGTPMWVIFTFEPKLKFSMTSPSITFTDLTISPTITASAGMEYNNGVYNPISNIGFIPQVQLPQLNINTTFGFTLGCEGVIATKIDGAVGPSIGFEPGAYMDFDLKNLCMEGGFYAKANAGFEFGVFGIGFSQELNLYDWKKPYLQQCIADKAPIISAFSATPIRGNRPLNTTFSYAAHDSDALDVLTRTLNFGDNTLTTLNQNSGVVTHMYQAPGQYVATFSVDDGHAGGKSSENVNIIVTDVTINSAPIVNLSLNPQAGMAPLKINASYKITDPDGDLVIAFLSYGDGTVDTIRDVTTSKTHLYPSKGAYKVILTANDGKGGVGKDSAIVDVQGNSNTITPSVQVTPSHASTSQTFSQPGSGFTPNSSAKLYFVYPDGHTDSSTVKTTDASGSFTNSYTVPATMPRGNYQYYARDLATQIKTASVSYTVDPDITPSVQVSPSHGATGQIFSEPGAGFTPNSTAKLYFVYPDGHTDSSNVKSTDASGSYANSYTVTTASQRGGYQYYARDVATQIKSNTVSFTVDADITPSVQVSPSHGATGQTFSEPGAGFTPNSTAKLYFVYPDGHTDSSTVKPTDASGSFTNSYTVPSTMPRGNYQYYARDVATQIKTASVSYTVDPDITPSVQVSPSHGATGQTFSEPGAGFTPNSTAKLYFVYPDGHTDSSTVKPTDASGSFTNSYTVPSTMPRGNYQYYARDLATQIKTASVSYTVDPDITPSVQVTPSHASTGQTFSQPGSGFTPNNTAKLYFIYPDGHTDSSTVKTTDASGSFTNSYTVPSTMPRGNYQYYARDVATQIKTASVSYTVDPDITPSVQVSPSHGATGQTFSQPGVGFTPNSTAKLYFIYPDGHTDSSTVKTTDASGSFSNSYTVTLTMPRGNYQYYARDLTTQIKTASVSYTVDPDITPSVQVSPSHGTTGQIFSEPGLGFTPNSTAKLYFVYPDGHTDSSNVKTTDANGQYVNNYTVTTASSRGLYQYYARDVATQIKSNIVSYTIDP
jgi:hypothetical protein